MGAAHSLVDGPYASMSLISSLSLSLRACGVWYILNLTGGSSPVSIRYSKTRPDPYPMPRIDELIDRLGKEKFITALDLTKGYWQVPVAPET